MEEKQDYRVARTQRHLKESFFELIQEKPIDKITIRELAERAEVSRSTFYLHYDSIFDIAKSIEEDMLFEYREGFRKTINENKNYSTLIEELITFSFRHKYENLQYSRMLYMNHGSSELISQYNKIAAEELKSAFPGKWSDLFTTVLNFYVCGIINLIHEWILGDKITGTPEELSALVIEITKNGENYLNILSK
ncbi:MAG: TetR/AcrR family transcriptional regulator [Clostridia bacterium]|nr:TetR/AcrR family transcriptional regulator [Clostridia bacterium]